MSSDGAMDLMLLREFNEKIAFLQKDAASLKWIREKLDLFLQDRLGCRADQLYVTASAVPDLVMDVTIIMLIAGGEWREKAREWRKELKRE